MKGTDGVHLLHFGSNLDLWRSGGVLTNQL